MTINEMLIRIETLKLQRMHLACKDRWNRDDYKRDDEMLEEILNLKKEIEKLEENA
jgi:hypothetical protein